ncbi:hypothetical protein ED312_19400 [Sinomicrobium pectinilyticum]|uniref:Uncharacterized protein n=1 Tax=Sinomicrobium pectinilyticum TaxID=1084421 RepID=A0A3N0DRA2_SINP1|nr:hypothetical protein [Sinomicrobium pectinilyticum]RNL78169.1 hypothetical protein ED312_19400 [Sinomicrobium pectinilyticum]
MGVLLCSLWYPQTSYAHASIRSSTQNPEIRLLGKENTDILFIIHCLKTQKITETSVKRKLGNEKFVFPDRLPLVFFAPPYISPVKKSPQDRSSVIHTFLFPYHIFW